MATTCPCTPEKQESNKNNMSAVVLVYRYDILDFQVMEMNLHGINAWPLTI